MRELPNNTEYEPYDLRLTLDKGFLFKNGKFAPFTLRDVVQINYLYHYENYAVCELHHEFGISFDVIKRILSRYQKGDFDKFINRGDSHLKASIQDDDYDLRFEKFLKGKSADFASFIRKGCSISQSSKNAHLDIDEVDLWLLKGEKGIKPYDEFYQDFFKAKKQLVDERTPLMLEAIELGLPLEKASKKADLSVDDVKKWIEMGRDEITPYDVFYVQYSAAMKAVCRKRIGSFMQLVKSGKELNVAAIQSGLDVGDVKEWIGRGKEGISPYNQFYKSYILSKQDYIKDRLDIFILKTKEGKAINQSAFEAGLDDDEVRTWLEYGKEGKEPYDEFYQDYMMAVSDDLD